MKHRNSFVSNSSSSSFILFNASSIDYFNKAFPLRENKLYNVSDIKSTLINFISDFTKNVDVNKKIDFDDVWNKYFDGKVPEYFKWSVIDEWLINDWNFFNIVNVIRSIPDSGYLTDAYDRDLFAEYCHIPDSHFTYFDCDL